MVMNGNVKMPVPMPPMSSGSARFSRLAISCLTRKPAESTLSKSTRRITSTFAPEFVPAIQAALQHPSNAHVKFFDGLFHGYVRCDVDQERWRADFRAVATVLATNSPVQTLATFEIADGEAGAVPA